MTKDVRRNPPPEDETTRFRVASLVKLGWSDARIAQELGIAPQMVYHHVSNLYGEAGIDGRHRGGWQFKKGDSVGRRGALRRWLQGDEE